jgi:hypothetical protein
MQPVGGARHHPPTEQFQRPAVEAAVQRRTRPAVHAYRETLNGNGAVGDVKRFLKQKNIPVRL